MTEKWNGVLSATWWWQAWTERMEEWVGDLVQWGLSSWSLFADSACLMTVQVYLPNIFFPNIISEREWVSWIQAGRLTDERFVSDDPPLPGTTALDTCFTPHVCFPGNMQLMNLQLHASCGTVIGPHNCWGSSSLKCSITDLGPNLKPLHNNPSFSLHF